MVGVNIAEADQSTDAVCIKNELPQGNFTLVGVDIDTTGRRLIDEIVQLAAYTPTDYFQQYIMPYMNLNPAARQRHQVRVISIGFYRMLKSMQTYKIIKSKSEVAALRDFLDWLEKIKSKTTDSDGIVLIYHEQRKFIPYMILESLKKYGLLDRFSKTVKSFANTFNLAKSCVTDTKNYSLRKLSKILSQSKKENANAAADSTTKEVKAKRSTNLEALEGGSQFDGNASVRAKLAFNVAVQLSNSEAQEPGSSQDSCPLFEAIKPYAKPIDCDIQELGLQNENLERQNSFRPVFLNYFKTTLYHRVRAVKFRIILAEHGFDLATLKAIWTGDGKKGLSDILQAIQNLKTHDKAELVDILDSYFDPSKTPVKPTVKSTNRRRNKRNNYASNKGRQTSPRSEFGAGGDKSESLSSTNSPSPSKNTKQRRGSRNGLRAKNKEAKNATTPVAPPPPTVAVNASIAAST